MSERTYALDVVSPAKLAPEAYWLPTVLEREYDTVFANAWQYVGSRQALSGPGSFLTQTLGRTPIVVVMTGTRELRAFRNVCLHRCHEVVRGHGMARSFTCPYHGWVYSLEGELVHTPHAALPHSLRLTQLPLATLGPLIFVAPSDDAPPFAELVGAVAEQIAACGLDLDDLEHAAHDEWHFAANWKVGIENFLECYHCSIAHPGLSSIVDVRPNCYDLKAWRYASSQIGPSKIQRAHSFEGPIAQAQFHYLWPNCTITINPGFPNLFINTWLPDGPERTIGFGDTFFGAAVAREKRDEMLAFNAEVSREDDLLVQSVQRGLRTNRSGPRYLEREESLVDHFQRLVIAAIDPSAEAGQPQPVHTA